MSAKKAEGGTPFDLSKLDTSEAAETGAVLEVLDFTPPFNPLGIKITLAGKDSDLWRKTVNKQANKRNQRWKPGQSIMISAEEIDVNSLDLLATVTLAWEGVILTPGAEPLPCTKENVKMLYERFVFIREQVDEFIGDRANFLSK